MDQTTTLIAAGILVNVLLLLLLVVAWRLLRTGPRRPAVAQPGDEAGSSGSRAEANEEAERLTALFHYDSWATAGVNGVNGLSGDHPTTIER